MEVFLVFTRFRRDDPELDSIWSTRELAERRATFLAPDPNGEPGTFIQQRPVDNPGTEIA